MWQIRDNRGVIWDGTEDEMKLIFESIEEGFDNPIKEEC